MKILLAAILLISLSSHAQTPVCQPDYIGWYPNDTNLLTLVVNNTRVISMWHLGKQMDSVRQYDRRSPLSIWCTLDTNYYGMRTPLEFRRYRAAKRIYNCLTPDGQLRNTSTRYIYRAIMDYQSLFVRIH